MNSLDKSNMLGAIDNLYLQLEQTWNDVKQLQVDPRYSKAENIVVVGMGGSALGPHVVKSLYFESLKIPLEIINGYNLPGYANENTLVVLSSNSGTTEEVLNASLEAKTKNCMIMGMCTGGKLAEFLKENNCPSYIFDQKHNPSGQPRMSTGYMILGMMGLFFKAGLIGINENEIIDSINLLKNNINIKNLAQEYANKLSNKVVVIVGSTFLSGTVHTVNNQLNENAKNFSSYFLIPELNHHLMEGLGFPKSNQENLIYLFINSNLFIERIKKRYSLTKEVVEKNGIKTLEYNPIGKTKLEQSFEVLLFGSYLSFYIAIQNGLDPSPIPWADFFKERLA